MHRCATVQVTRWPSSPHADGEAATLTRICCFLTLIGRRRYRRSSLPSPCESRARMLGEGSDRVTRTDDSREPAEPRAIVPAPAEQHRHTPWL
jgi:hypothetical protein